MIGVRMKIAKPLFEKRTTIAAAIIVASFSTMSFAIQADEGRDDIRKMAQYLIANHPSMNAARQSVFASESDRAAAESAFYPVLQLSGSHSWTGRDATSSTVSPSSIDYESTLFDLALNQNLYAGGATMANLSKSGALLEGSKYRREDTKETLSLRAVESIMNILRDRERLLILEGSLARHENIAELVRKQVKWGKEAASSNAQAKSRVALIRAEYEFAKGEFKSSSAIYKELTGKDLSLVGVSREGLRQRWPESLLESGWDVDSRSKQYVSSNPSVLEAEAAYSAARDDIQIANAGYLPSVDLSISTNLMNDGDSDYDQYAASTYEDDYSVSLNVSWGLELGGGDFDRKKAASSRHAEASYNLQDRKKAVSEAVKVLNSELESAQAASGMRAEHSKEAAEVVGAYTKQYKAGSQGRTLLDLLTVENEHLTALNNELLSNYEEILLQARISRMGGQLSNVLGIK